MAISEFEIFKIKKVARNFCDNRNKHYPADQLYIDFRLEGQNLYIFEVRPKWNDPSEKHQIMVAKFRYIKSEPVWKLYWQRQNMKWSLYEPNSQNKELERLFEEVWNDSNGCFWG